MTGEVNIELGCEKIFARNMGKHPAVSLRRHAASVAAMLILILTGCQYNPFAHRFLKREPTMEEVAGTYALKEVYVDMVESGLNEKIRANSPKPTIELRADGSASLRSFPVFRRTADGFEYTFEGFEDLETRWHILPTGCVSSGSDDATTVYGISFDFAKDKNFEHSPTLTGDKSVDGMIFTLYDGDQGQILGFIKQTGAE